MKKHRVGIILNDLVCSTYIHDTVQVLKSENDIELILILEEIRGRSWSKPGNEFWQCGALDLLNYLTFMALQMAERRLIGFLDNSVREHFKRTKIDPGSFTDCIKIKPSWLENRAVSCYEDEDLKSLVQLELDIIVSGKEPHGKAARTNRLGF